LQKVKKREIEQLTMAGGDWRAATAVVWNLDLMVAGEKEVVGGGPVVDCWNLDGWNKENKDLVT
jgi:hypothetical protein